MINDITSVELLSHADDGALKDCGFSPGNITLFKVGKSRLASLLSTTAPPLLGHSSRPGAKWTTFLSHHKVAVSAATAVLLQTFIQDEGGSAFFDQNEDHLDLRSLMENVKQSQTLTIILSEKVLTRPWCLSEIYTEVKSGIPIVCVRIEGEPFDFATAKECLTWLDVNIDASGRRALEDSGVDILDAAFELSSCIPAMRARAFDHKEGKRVREAQLGQIYDDIKAAKFSPNPNSKAEWLQKRGKRE